MVIRGLNRYLCGFDEGIILHNQDDQRDAPSSQPVYLRQGNLCHPTGGVLKRTVLVKTHQEILQTLIATLLPPISSMGSSSATFVGLRKSISGSSFTRMI